MVIQRYRKSYNKKMLILLTQSQHFFMVKDDSFIDLLSGYKKRDLTDFRQNL